MGVLRAEGHDVPMLDVFVRGDDVSNKVIIAELATFLRWTQYPPIDHAGDEAYVVEGRIFLRVRDLNSDIELREKIIRDDPDWLKDKPDKDRFLRAHVIVNVFEKMILEVM